MQRENADRETPFPIRYGFRTIGFCSVFIKHKTRSDAIAQNGNPGWLGIFGGDNISNPIDVRPNNIFHSEPSTLAVAIL